MWFSINKFDKLNLLKREKGSTSMFKTCPVSKWWKNIIAAYIENLFFQNKEWAQNISILLIPYNINADNGYLGNKKH